MDASLRDAYDSTRDFSRKAFRSACYAPFSSLYFTPLGEVKMCCKSPYVLGNMATERLDDVWHGKRLKAMRHALRNYKFEAGCQFCQWQIESGRFQGAHTSVFEPLPIEDPEATWPRQLEFALSNLCNYECIMCYGELSSRIRANRDRLPPLPMVYGDQFFADLRKYLPHLHTAKWHGGEPFLAPENYRIWDMLIEDGTAPEFTAAVTTNASTFNAKIERVLEKLPFHVTISTDGITQETLEAVRVGSKHSQVMANIERFRQYAERRGTSVSLSVCLMRQNWHEFADILRYAEERGFLVYLNTVIEPEHCSLFTLPVDEQQAVLEKLEALDATLARDLKLNYPVFLDALQGLRGNIANVRRLDVHAVRSSWQRPVDPISTAWELVGAGKYSDAAEQARKVPPTDTRYYFARTALAHALRRAGDLAGAEQVLVEAMALTKRRPEVFIERAWLRQAAGRLDEGIEDAKQALLLADGPEHEFGAQSALAFLHRERGHYAESKAAFDRMVALRPEDPKPRVHRGWLYEMAGQHTEAAGEVEAALRIAPGDAEAEDLRQHLAR
jgi:MoaA/NifB/PqqE/SkfB family radical SAM enzyme/Tfp pilus assembly protein PilF